LLELSLSLELSLANEANKSLRRREPTKPNHSSTRKQSMTTTTTTTTGRNHNSRPHTAHSPFAPALRELLRSEHSAPIIARIETALGTHASIAPRITEPFLRRVQLAERSGMVDPSLMPDKADAKLVRRSLRFNDELLLVWRELERDSSGSLSQGQEERRRAFVSLFAGDEARATDLRVTLDARAATAAAAFAAAAATSAAAAAAPRRHRHR
jgi:hypothetical protein